MFNQQLRPTLPTLFRGLCFVPADISRETHELLLDFLFASQTHFFSIDDHHKVAGIDVRSKYRFPFAAKKICHRHSDTTKRLVLRINDVPFSLYLARLGRKRLHESSPKKEPQT